MEFKEFESRLRLALEKPLPGQSAQYKMTPPNRPFTKLESLDHSQIKQSAVAALFVNRNNSPHLILTQRSTYRGVHSGQISFPGGRKEHTDQDFRETALRETEEEIGLGPDNIKLLGQLTSLYIPPSNFFVNVFLGLVKGDPDLKPEPAEVDRIIIPDFNHFLQDSSIIVEDIHVRESVFRVPVFKVEGHTVWGATAMMISEIREMVL